jgi:hypothetical protein
MCDLSPGDIVECVDDRPARPESQIMPDLGALYAIASVRPVEDGHSVRLKELTPSCYLGGLCACGECGWNALRFRKVYRPKSGFLQALAVRTPERV